MDANKTKLVVVDWKANWCQKCKVVYPEYEKLSEEHPQAVFLVADVDELKYGKSEAGIEVLPTFHFIKNDELVHQFSGVRINEMKKTIEKHK